MKKFIPTLILVVLCIGGFWYASSHSFFKDQSGQQKKLITLKAADIQSFSITDGDATTELAKKDGGWVMSKPDAYPVAGFAADGWTSSFADVPYTGVIEEKPADLSAFGLDKPSQRFEAKLKDGTTHTLLIGKSLPMPGSHYAKLGDSDAVYEMSDDTVNGLNKKALELIETNAVTFPMDKVTSVTAEWQADSWQLDKAEAAKTVFESKWKIGSKELTPDNGSAIVSEMSGWTTDRLPKAAATASQDQKKPPLRIQIKTDDAGKQSTLTYTGQVDQDVVWIQKEGGSWAYAVPLTQIQTWFAKGKA